MFEVRHRVEQTESLNRRFMLSSQYLLLSECKIDKNGNLNIPRREIPVIISSDYDLRGSKFNLFRCFLNYQKSECLTLTDKRVRN